MSEFSDTIALDDSRLTLNGDLKGARNKTMLELLGNPRGNYSQECQGPTNDRIERLIDARDIGPFKVRGLKPAVDTLEQILALVKERRARNPFPARQRRHALLPLRPRQLERHQQPFVGYRDRSDDRRCARSQRRQTCAERPDADLQALQSVRVLLGRRFPDRGRDALRGFRTVDPQMAQRGQIRRWAGSVPRGRYARARGSKRRGRRAAAQSCRKS